MSAVCCHAGLRPEERKDAVRAQVAESARLLGELEARRDLTAAAFELELRLQIAWLSSAVNHWREAAAEEALIVKARKLYLKREGPGQ